MATKAKIRRDYRAAKPAHRSAAATGTRDDKNRVREKKPSLSVVIANEFPTKQKTWYTKRQGLVSSGEHVKTKGRVEEVFRHNRRRTE